MTATDPLAQRLDDGLAELGQSDPGGGREALLSYLSLLARWNRAYNLSAVREPLEMVSRHVLDSLVIRPHLPTGPLLDLGSGAGLPGLPIALTEPERNVTLLDSNGKKTRFLEQVVLELRLDNVRVIRARAESGAAGSGYAVVTSRAYADLGVFWAHAAPALAPGGVACALKGQRPEAELAALPDDGVSSRVIRLRVPGVSAERHLVVLRKA
jgi:16S rRNA (guanine527-N7)-methyltransferase